MIELSIPGKGVLTLHHFVLDVNGTIAADGSLIDGVAERLERLAEHLEIHMLTADTHGKQATIDAQVGFAAARITRGHEAEQKADYANRLGASGVVAVGNGRNDADMLHDAAISIAVLGTEGLSVQAFLVADVLAPSITDALDLLLEPRRLVATLRH